MFGNAATPGLVTTHRYARDRRRLPLPDRLPRALPEFALLVAVYWVYKFGRKLANGGTTDAFRHARGVWAFERDVHLPSERLVQRAAMHWEPVIHTANYIYATVHFPAMAIFLAYMFLRRRAHYLWIRRAIVIQTLLALVGHLLFPLAPPRMLHGSGMVDTAARYGPAVYSSKPQSHTMSNQFAAMPSLHVGWALAIAVGMIAAHRSRWRWLWVLHPVMMLLVVVSTANHYWLDCIVGCALLGVGLLLVPGPAPEPWPQPAAFHLPRPSWTRRHRGAPDPSAAPAPHDAQDRELPPLASPVRMAPDGVEPADRARLREESR